MTDTFDPVAELPEFLRRPAPDKPKAPPRETEAEVMRRGRRIAREMTKRLDAYKRRRARELRALRRAKK